MIMESEILDKIKDEAKTYGKALGKVGKLRLIGIVSRVLGLFLLIFCLILCGLAVFTFAAVAAIDAMSACMPVWAASLIVGCAYLVLIIVAVIARKPLFIHPFIALLSKQVIGTEEELAIETMKAEHAVELEQVRIQSEVENATRTVTFYINLLGRLKNLLFSKKKS